MGCTGLRLQALESLRTVAAHPNSLNNVPALPGPLSRVVECCQLAGAATVFARPGLSLPANPYEQALLSSLGQAGVDVGSALSHLPPWLSRERAEALIWALADLFEFLCSERVSTLRDCCMLPNRVI